MIFDLVKYKSLNDRLVFLLAMYISFSSFIKPIYAILNIVLRLRLLIVIERVKVKIWKMFFIMKKWKDLIKKKRFFAS